MLLLILLSTIQSLQSYRRMGRSALPSCERCASTPCLSPCLSHGNTPLLEAISLGYHIIDLFCMVCYAMTLGCRCHCVPGCPLLVCYVLNVRIWLCGRAVGQGRAHNERGLVCVVCSTFLFAGVGEALLWCVHLCSLVPYRTIGYFSTQSGTHTPLQTQYPTLMPLG